jgi:hypothetical protein
MVPPVRTSPPKRPSGSQRSSASGRSGREWTPFDRRLASGCSVRPPSSIRFGAGRGVAPDSPLCAIGCAKFLRERAMPQFSDRSRKALAFDEYWHRHRSESPRVLEEIPSRRVGMQRIGGPDSCPRDSPAVEVPGASYQPSLCATVEREQPGFAMFGEASPSRGTDHAPVEFRPLESVVESKGSWKRSGDN